jgi:NAD(P)-dependent dehydrogenase (short-subunit alcohol dehydrogenase family)
MMPITSPFDARSTALEVIAGHDLSGQTALVTGASSGLGVETVKTLLSAGAEVIMAVRDTQKGETVAAELRQATGNPKAHVLELNLGSLTSVRQAAAQALSKWSKLHIIINNAGVMATPFSHTDDGFEMQFGTNHLGHFLFLNLLLPALRAAKPSRVVVLSSIGHRRSDIHFDDLNYQTRPYEKWEAYGQSKTANVLFAVGWNQRYGKEGITANALHPGGIQTGLQKFIPEDEQRAMGWIDEQGNVNPLFKTVEQGAATSIWAAVGNELEGHGGLYLEDCHEALPFDPAQPYSGYMPYVRDPESAKRLWEISSDLVGLTT